jgi:hypothetical protein
MGQTHDERIGASAAPPAVFYGFRATVTDPA